MSVDLGLLAIALDFMMFNPFFLVSSSELPSSDFFFQSGSKLPTSNSQSSLASVLRRRHFILDASQFPRQILNSVFIVNCAVVLTDGNSQ